MFLATRKRISGLKIGALIFIDLSFFFVSLFIFLTLQRNLREALPELVQWLSDIHRDLSPLFPFTSPYFAGRLSSSVLFSHGHVAITSSPITFLHSHTQKQEWDRDLLVWSFPFLPSSLPLSFPSFFPSFLYIFIWIDVLEG